MTKTDAALRLLAEDADDIGLISAALQDAIATVGDFTWEPAGRRFTIAFNRFRWERAAGPGARVERVRSALQVGSVLSVKSRRIRRDPKDAVVELLSLEFRPGDAPGGALVLSFAGGADLRLDVECLDAILADVSQPWTTRRAPQHG